MAMQTVSPAALLLVAALSAGAAGQTVGEFAPLEIRRVERVYLDDVHAGVGGERVVDLYFRALDGRRQPVEELRPVDVEVREGLREVAPDDVVEMTTLEEAGLGVTCVIALDASRTMLGEPFERARSAAVGLLDRLGSRDAVAIVAFASAAEVVASFGDGLASARGRLEALEIDSEAMSTVLYDGLYRSVELVRHGFELPRRALVVVFSDGRDGGSSRSLEEVVRLANGGENEPRIPIFAVGYAGRGGGGIAILENLAAETGGSSSRATRLDEFHDAVLREMRRSYLLRYESEMDGRRHLVEVAVDGKPDSRSSTHPRFRGGLWLWPLFAGLAVVALLVVRALVWGGSAGSLRVLNGPLAEQRFDLRRGRTRIGSLGDNDVVIDSEVVSRYHAEIRAGHKKIEIEDLRSTNGTLVNGVPIQASPIQPGDRIRIGDVEMVLEP